MVAFSFIFQEITPKDDQKMEKIGILSIDLPLHTGVQVTYFLIEFNIFDQKLDSKEFNKKLNQELEN